MHEPKYVLVSYMVTNNRHFEHRWILSMVPPYQIVRVSLIVLHYLVLQSLLYGFKKKIKSEKLEQKVKS